MSKLLVATKNAGKQEWFKRVFHEVLPELALTWPQDLGLNEPFEETGETFEENSLLKANHYWQLSQLPTLTDDAGLEIDVLNGAPGVHSRRIDGIERSDEEARRMILEKVSTFPEAERTAKLVTVVTLRVAADMDWQARFFIEGVIKDSPLPIETGLPYRGIMWLPQFKKFLPELTKEEHDLIDHRKKAILQLLPQITQYVL